MLLAACGSAPPEAAAPPQLLSRDTLFGNPDRALVLLSPDGKQISYLSPDEGVMNVWVAPLDNLAAARAVTNDRKRGIRFYQWAYTNNDILYLQDTNGDENWQLFRVNLTNDETTNLTPIEGVAVQAPDLSPDHPEHALVAINERDKRLHDLFRLNILTGEREMIEQNPGFAGYVADDDLQVRLASKMTPDGGMQFLQKDGKEWKELFAVGSDDALTTGPAGFDKSRRTLYLRDSRDRNTSALVSLDLETGEKQTVFENDGADVSALIRHPTEHQIQAVSWVRERREWKVLDESIADDLEFLREASEGELIVNSRTVDDSRWIAAYLRSDGPIEYYLYEREPKKATRLFSNRKELEGLPLAPMHSTTIKARDGLELVSYYTLPLESDPDADGKPVEPVPMVLFVHGGPWGRDNWGYHPYHQWLSNRGYAVLSVNFRGSTGLGKDFTNAGDMEWAGKMHDDLLDATDWAVAEGIAAQDKVCIMGGSYGGYSTLVGLTFTPDKFACGVDIVGPANLVTLLSSIPPYWEPMKKMFAARVGDVETDEGRALLTERSPLTHADKIVRPLLIGQGANDPRVKQAESDQIVTAMKGRGIPVTYVLYPDEGHGFARPENNKSFNAVTEAFLAETLGGRVEPIGDDLQGSSIQVPEGAGLITGLQDALGGSEAKAGSE
jgi:dipeptidyl aminopeptidase/acylaminoacyl peptidase